MFRQAFLASIVTLTSDAAIDDKLWNDIVGRYSEAGRHYHNLDHLDALIRELSAVENYIKDWDLLVLAVAYHDVIYDPLRQDNEQASADFVMEQLGGIISRDRRRHCVDIILATQSHEPGNDADAALFSDADLAILGAEPVAYRRYTLQIRKEYDHYPDIFYKPGRIKVLRHFLNMPRIFKTEVFYDKYELRARLNLEEEVKWLSETDD